VLNCCSISSLQFHYLGAYCRFNYSCVSMLVCLVPDVILIIFLCYTCLLIQLPVFPMFIIILLTACVHLNKEWNRINLSPSCSVGRTSTWIWLQCSGGEMENSSCFVSSFLWNLPVIGRHCFTVSFCLRFGKHRSTVLLNPKSCG
jgi:hypothetical protein